jgi:anthranilate phosphoribosyltransferase
MRDWTIDPADHGFAAGRPEELAGGPPAQNAAAVTAVLTNAAPPTAAAAVILNAAAALYVSRSGAMPFGDAVRAASQGLRDGAGMRALERLRTALTWP